MTASKLQAGSAFPSVQVPNLNGDMLDLGKPDKDHDWRLVVVYRGKHCPLCTRYLKELDHALPQLNVLGVDVVAVSADSRERADTQIAEVQPRYRVGYDLSIEQMQTLGLYISSPRLGMDAERPFAEPGLFVINAEGNLQMIDISNVPFARPSIDAMLMGLNYVRNMDGDFPVNGSFAA